jgi:putative spermidine/putrescine transport system ATP-binding protein
MPYIELRDIVKFFGKDRVLHDINLDIERGQLVTLLGPSGCGKSTLLRCIAGMENVSGGSITLDNHDITNLPVQKRDIGMVFQQYSLFPNLSVKNNVGFGLKVQKFDKSVIKQRVERMLDIVGLSDRAGHYPHQLSGGQKQRVALARALVCEPKVLLLDEPLSAIDALLRRNLQVEIRRIQRELKITAIFVTHDQHEAMVMSDTIHLLNSGTIEQSGSPTSLYTRPKSVFAANFIGHYNVLKSSLFSSVVNDAPACGVMAIRPEIVAMSHSPRNDEKSFHVKGRIADSVALGNIIRYKVNCGNFSLDVDVLFEKDRVFNTHETVHLSISKEDCVAVG